MKKQLLSVIIATMASYSVAAQITDPPFPQIFTPNAAEMGKYGRTPVNYFNGLPNITVPLTEVNAKGYTLPVYLTYHASGNKPDQHPGWVGQGWTLHAGGSITRVINGQKDERSEYEYLALYGHSTASVNPGYFYRMETTQTSNWNQASTLLTLAYDGCYRDYEPDEFLINIEGIQASFYFVDQDEIRIISRGDASFEAEYELSTDSNGLTVYPHPTNDSGSLKADRYTYIRSITVRDREGNKYYFGGDDKAIEYSIEPRPSFTRNGETLSNNGTWSAIATANTWMLTRIERPDGEVITFHYVKDGTPVVKNDIHHGETYVVTDGQPQDGGNLDTRDHPTFLDNISFYMLQPSYLTRIECRLSGDLLDFSHTPTTELEYDILESEFNLRVGNYSSYNGTSYPFSGWMSRNYYNQLSAIDGTGRHIAFSYTASTTQRLKLLEVQFKTDGGNTGSVDNKYSFTYDTTALPGYNAKKSDIWGFFNDIYYGNNLGSIGAEAIRTPVEAKMKAEILTEITYPTGGKTVFEYEPHYYSKVVSQYTAAITSTGENKMAGGLRIKSITDYPRGGKQEKRTFTYLQSTGNLSSGILSGNPKARTEGHVEFHYTSYDYEIDYVIHSENPILPLSETDGNHVTYSRVKETFPDGGYTVYTYYNHDSAGCSDEDPALTLGYCEDSTPYSRIQSRAIARGLLKSREDYKFGDTKVRSETNEYHSDYGEYFNSVAGEKYCCGAFTLLSYVKKYCFYPYLSQKTVIDYPDSGSPVTSVFNYQYNVNRRRTSETHTVGGVSDGTVTYYPSDRSGSIYTAMINAGMSGIPVGQAKLRKGNVVAATEVTYKLTDVSTSTGTASCPVPEAVYSAEFTAPVTLSSYQANPAAYRSDPDITYLRYDVHANLLGTETRDGIRSTYAWDRTALHPVLVARGVDPGEVGQQDVTRNESYSLVYAGNNSFQRSFITTEPSTITISVSAAYGYAWLIYYSIDGQTGHIVNHNIAAAPTQQWLQYITQYNPSVQVNLPAGSHSFLLGAADWYKTNSANSNPAGTISCNFKESGQATLPGEALALYDFEDETGSTAGFNSTHAHFGSYTINHTVPGSRNYVVDYMLYENNAWGYHRESYSGGSKTLGAAGKLIDNIRVFPADCDLATAGYNAAGLMTFRTDSRGVTESYEYDGLRRLVRIRDNNRQPVEEYSYNYAHGTGNNIHNSVTTKTFTAENSATSYRTAVSYIDSLGRPSQNVLVNGAASGWDLVTYQDYDACGREFRKWLPAPVQVVSGTHAAGDYSSVDQIKTGGNQVYSTSDSYRYEQPVYEASPRDRVLEYYGPGSAWRSGSGHKVKTTLLSNVSTMSAVNYYRGFSLSWTGNTALTLTRTSASSASTMMVTQTEDEDEQKILEFKNSYGETVLVRQVLSASPFLDTYYVYDDFGRLAAVLPPEFVAQIGSTTSWNYSDLADYAYLYRYDSRGNCIARSFPGAGWTYTVFDKGNRPVLTQDAAQRAQNANYWTFALPDHIGRPVLRGTTTMSVSAFSDPYKTAVVKVTLPKTPTYSGTYKGYSLSGITLSSADLLEVDYYDQYGFAGTSPFPAANNADFAYDSSIGTSFSAYYSPSAQGLRTGSLLKVLDSSTGNQYLWSVSYYDFKSRLVQHRASTHLGGVEKDWFLYDFIGNVTKRKTEHKPSSGTSLVETTTQTYDTWDRPLASTHQIGSGTVKTVSNRAYDKAGRLYTESRSGNTSLKSTYAYNIRSWLTGITGTLFTETLKYQDGTTARWGGDVSQLSWKDNQSSNLKTYSLSYDTVGRLKTASFSDAGNTSVNYAEKVTQYDGRGNIRKLERYGRTGASTYGKIDDLVYTYSGNKVTSIKDTGSAAYSSDFRFSNGTNTSYAFTYDAAGRMTSDASKGITSITWNVLGLPQTVTFSSGAVINYSYAADGTKLREAKTVSSTTTLTDYTGNLILENGTRSRLLFDGGYVSMSNSGYHFFITDHLGSVRVVANTGGTAEEYNHYYPLGGPIAQYSSSTSLQPIKFQGKEWSAGKGLDLYDFGARRYDPATGRWISQDPMAEKYYAHSPYLFCAANPVRFVDPTGRKIVVRHTEDNTFSEYEWQEQNNTWGFYDSEGNLFDGSDDYISNLSSALSSLMEGNTGFSLVKELVELKKSIRIGPYNSNEYFPREKAIGWSSDNRSLSAPYVSLGHELAHAIDDLRGTMNHQVWIQKGTYEGLKQDIPFSELFSTYMENLIRKEHGLPLRTGYLFNETLNIYVGPSIVDSKRRSIFFNKEGQTNYKPVKKENRYQY